MEFTLIILKYIAILISGIFGIYGLVLNFKDENGKVTRAGKIALIILILSAIVALVSQSIEIYIKQSEKAQIEKQTLLELKQNTKILNEVNRSLSPLDYFKINFRVAFKISNNYTKRLDSLINQNFDSTLPLDVQIDNSYLPLLPMKKTEPIAYDYFKNNSAFLSIIKDPLPLDSIKASFYHPSDSDIHLSGYTRLESNDEFNHFIKYSTKTKTFTISSDFESNSKDWLSNGKIISVYDLLGAQLILELSPEKNQELRELIKIDRLMLQFSNGRLIVLNLDDFKRITTMENGRILYVVELPKTEEEFEKLRNNFD